MSEKSEFNLKPIAQLTFGADRAVLLKICRTMIHPSLDYGTPVYGTAKPLILCTLDSIQHSVIRLAIETLRTSPTISTLH